MLLSTPSMRYLITRPLPVVPRWMSLACIFSASYRVELTSLTTTLESSLMLVRDRLCRLSVSAPASLWALSDSTAWKLSS
ncbi:hypothetical protein D3C72_2242020 [compost metagenome]